MPSNTFVLRGDFCYSDTPAALVTHLLIRPAKPSQTTGAVSVALAVPG
jgi:hypothetical protein